MSIELVTFVALLCFFCGLLAGMWARGVADKWEEESQRVCSPLDPRDPTGPWADAGAVAFVGNVDEDTSGMPGVVRVTVIGSDGTRKVRLMRLPLKADCWPIIAVGSAIGGDFIPVVRLAKVFDATYQCTIAYRGERVEISA